MVYAELDLQGREYSRKVINVKWQESASDGAFLLPGNEVEHGEPKTVRHDPDREHDILCNRNFFWNGPVAAFDKKTDTKGNWAGKQCRLAEKITQQMAEKSLETWYNHRVQSSLFAVGKEQKC